MVIAVFAVVAVSGFVAYWKWDERGPRRPSISKAIERFRSSSSPAPTHFFQPRPGVYLYSGNGTESLSFLNTRQSQGPVEPGTITLDPRGCWTFRMDFNSFHFQTWQRCSTGGRLVELGGTTDQKFDFGMFKQSEHSIVTCHAPSVLADLGATAGTTWPVRCTGHSQTTGSNLMQAGTSTFVGREAVRVGGAAVPTLHSRQALAITGDQTGHVNIDLWLAASNGLPVREQHTISVVSPAPAPIGHVTYTERGSWAVTSLSPKH